MPAKHLGLADLPMMNSGNFSPTAFAAAIPVSLVFTVLTTHTFVGLQMQSLIRKSLIKQAKFVGVENNFKLLLRDNGLKSCLVPRGGHFRVA